MQQHAADGLPLLHDEQPPLDQCGWVRRPTEAHAECLRPLNRRSSDRRLHPIGLSNFLAAAEVTGTRLPRWNQPPELRQCLVMKLSENLNLESR